MYNVEKYINQCVDSIINQTYKNLDIILVDDGSPDRCGKIADEYEQKDSRISVIHKQNGGVSAARNTALDVAKGKFVMFVDGDDYLAEDAISFLHDELEKNNADIATGGTYDFRDNDGKHMNLTTKRFDKQFDKVDALKEFFREEYFSCVIWGRLYKREVIGKERFLEDVSFSEDFDFLYRILKNINRFTVNTNKDVTYYRLRTDSLANHTYDRKFEIEIELSKKVLEDVKNNFPKIESYAVGRLQRCIVRLINKYFKSNMETKGARYLFDEIKKYPMNLDFVSRIRLLLLRYFPGVLLGILKILGRV